MHSKNLPQGVGGLWFMATIELSDLQVVTVGRPGEGRWPRGGSRPGAALAGALASLGRCKWKMYIAKGLGGEQPRTAGAGQATSQLRAINCHDRILHLSTCIYTCKNKK